MRFIRRFMLVFGPLSSLFDFLTFAILLRVLHAGPTEFRTGWFVESLATQTLIVFTIRTRRTPFFRSHPSLPLTLAALGAVAVGGLLPATSAAGLLGFTPLPMSYFGALALLVVTYLTLVEVAKRRFFRGTRTAPPRRRPSATHRHVRRRAARYLVAEQAGTSQQRRTDRSLGDNTAVVGGDAPDGCHSDGVPLAAQADLQGRVIEVERCAVGAPGSGGFVQAAAAPHDTCAVGAEREPVQVDLRAVVVDRPARC
jgi:hypothetical protein